MKREKKEMVGFCVNTGRIGKEQKIVDDSGKKRRESDMK